MNPRVKNVKPEIDYTLHVWFTNEADLCPDTVYLDSVKI